MNTFFISKPLAKFFQKYPINVSRWNAQVTGRLKLCLEAF